MAEIKGIIAAMQTAMFADGSINEKELRNQINRQIAAGVDAVFCLGTNGELYIMDEAEKIRVMEIFVDEAATHYAESMAQILPVILYLGKAEEKYGMVYVGRMTMS